MDMLGPLGHTAGAGGLEASTGDYESEPEVGEAADEPIYLVS